MVSILHRQNSLLGIFNSKRACLTARPFCFNNRRITPSIRKKYGEVDRSSPFKIKSGIYIKKGGEERWQ